MLQNEHAGSSNGCRTLGRTPHFLIGDLAQLVNEVAIESALATVHMPAHHDAHVGFGIRSISSRIFKCHLGHTLDLPLSIKNVELVASCCCSFAAPHFGAANHFGAASAC